ncbi:MAG: helix-turn-helix domain-containing protein [bacterium]|nr:helix-turn-helix domain-containing protein [bacterium]
MSPIIIAKQKFDDIFRVNLFRKDISAKHPDDIGESIGESIGENIGEASEKRRGCSSLSLSKSQKQILKLLSHNSRLSAKEIAGVIGILDRNVESNMRKLKDYGLLVRHGKGIGK